MNVLKKKDKIFPLLLRYCKSIGMMHVYHLLDSINYACTDLGYEKVFIHYQTKYSKLNDWNIVNRWNKIWQTYIYDKLAFKYIADDIIKDETDGKFALAITFPSFDGFYVSSLEHYIHYQLNSHIRNKTISKNTYFDVINLNNAKASIYNALARFVNRDLNYSKHGQYQ